MKLLAVLMGIFLGVPASWSSATEMFPTPWWKWSPPLTGTQWNDLTLSFGERCDLWTSIKSSPVIPSLTRDSRGFLFPQLSSLAVFGFAERAWSKDLDFEFARLPSVEFLSEYNQAILWPTSLPGSEVFDALRSHFHDSVLLALRAIESSGIVLGKEIRTAEEIISKLRELDPYQLMMLDQNFQNSIWYWSPIHPTDDEEGYLPKGSPLR